MGGGATAEGGGATGWGGCRNIIVYSPGALLAGVVGGGLGGLGASSAAGAAGDSVGDLYACII